MASFYSGLAGRWRPRWADLLLLVFVFGLLLAIAQLSRGMSTSLAASYRMPFSLSPSLLPYYAGRSLIRMFAAYALSLLFAIGYGYAAARSRWAGRILVPLLDILQSVPVLGFLSITVTGFMALFPGNLMGLELASIFAIFTAQAWNMAFSFYQSLTTLPRELREAATLYHFSPWQRFVRLELPSAAIGLVWNSMMSFGGSWFFLAASEAITVLGQPIRLPGLGSYLAVAMARRDLPAIGYDLLTMVIIILVLDQVFWRPLVAWSRKFKMEETPDPHAPRSWVLTVLRRSTLARLLSRRVLVPMLVSLEEVLSRARPVPAVRRTGQLLAAAVAATAVLACLPAVVSGLSLLGRLSPATVGILFLEGLATLGRVLVAVVLGALWTVPLGVAIGQSPRLARLLQPVVQILSAFPANMLFPFAVLLYLRLGINFQIGAIPLLMLGTQWYILFNTIAGALSIPSDLREAARIFGLQGMMRWQQLILPAIAPSLLTGLITAAGGAWNASIVAEYVTWGHQRLVAFGLGAAITEATARGQGAVILLGIMWMSVLVVLVNRLLWRRLYGLIEQRYRL